LTNPDPRSIYTQILDFVHHPVFSKIQFQKLGSFPFSGMGMENTYSIRLLT
jgi:hypothetical protein